MPRSLSTEMRIRCRICNDFTQKAEPVIIHRVAASRSKTGFGRYDIKIKCAICNQMCHKTLNKYQVKLLPKEVLDIPIKSEIVDMYVKEGGFLPILPLIGAIAAGITALSAAGGATANAIIGAKNAAETERHNRELEMAARGQGLISRGDDELIEKSINFLTGKGFTVSYL